MMTVASLL